MNRFSNLRNLRTNARNTNKRKKRYST